MEISRVVRGVKIAPVCMVRRASITTRVESIDEKSIVTTPMLFALVSIVGHTHRRLTRSYEPMLPIGSTSESTGASDGATVKLQTAPAATSPVSTLRTRTFQNWVVPGVQRLKGRYCGSPIV